MPWWGYVVAVAGMVGGALVGVVKVLTGLDHDWRVCKCHDCKSKRYVARRKRGDQVVGMHADGEPIWDDVPKPGRVKAYWISTAQLEPGMIVRLNNIGYQVKNVRTDRRGYAVELRNMRTRKMVAVTIAWAVGNRKYWEPVDSFGSEIGGRT